MDYQEYLSKQLTIFHFHLHSDFGILIKVATCVAFGAVCGWIMSLLTFIVYKVAVCLGVQPMELSTLMEDDIDLDMDVEDGNDQPLHRSQDIGDWLLTMRPPPRQPLDV
ncbi:uncharacterized protein [Drosophila kikkawai]|uniref:Uncharacterized protein n=1 Tax=Drosophila kikkawai TaxID=30033 RepID=A0A6P4IYT6_DROKI|nr:uncharacterized protein LOC108082759 [Drosophila kikkawai]